MSRQGKQLTNLDPGKPMDRNRGLKDPLDVLESKKPKNKPKPTKQHVNRGPASTPVKEPIVTNGSKNPLVDSMIAKKPHSDGSKAKNLAGTLPTSSQMAVPNEPVRAPLNFGTQKGHSGMPIGSSNLGPAKTIDMNYRPLNDSALRELKKKNATRFIHGKIPTPQEKLDKVKLKIPEADRKAWSSGVNENGKKRGQNGRDPEKHRNKLEAPEEEDPLAEVPSTTYDPVIPENDGTGEPILPEEETVVPKEEKSSGWSCSIL